MKKVTLLAMTILLCGLAPMEVFAQRTAREAQAHYDRGKQLYDEKNYESAIEAFTAALKLNRKYAEAYYYRGYAYAQKEDWDRAIADYTEALKLNRKYAEAYLRRGRAYSNKKDYNRAIADFNEALKIDRKYADAYHGRGWVYVEKGDYDRAITDYTAALKINPNYADVYYNRGIAYYDKKDYDRAIADYTKAIEINPNDVDAYYARGLAYRNKNDYDRAIADYTKVIEINPNDVDAYYARGLAYRNKNDYDRAIADYTKAIEIDPGNLWYYWNRGEVYSILAKRWWKGGNGIVFVTENVKAGEFYGLALKDYEKAKELAPPENHERLNLTIWETQSAKKRADTWIAERKVVNPEVERKQNPNRLNRTQYRKVSSIDELSSGVLSGTFPVGTKIAFTVSLFFRPSGREYTFVNSSGLIDIISSHNFVQDIPESCLPNSSWYVPDPITVYVTVKRTGGGGECSIDIIDW